MRHSFVISPDQAGKRLDQFLWEQELFPSRSRAQVAINEGCVTCDGQAISKSSFKLHAGNEVVYTPAAASPVSDQLIPDRAPLDILYQDEDVVVVAKPAGVCVHAGAGNPHGTLVERVLGHGIALSSIGQPLRPGVVHRLDKGTSGVMVMAKTDRAHVHLMAQFAKKTVEKTYLALVWGGRKSLAETIQTSLGRHPTHRQKFASVRRVSDKGKEAITHVRVISTRPLFSFLEVRLETGRTHQIRVHLSESGTPIVADALYGGGRKHLTSLKLENALRQTIDTAGALFLHAFRLSFRHPITEENMTFSVPLPPCFLPFIDSEWQLAYERSGNHRK